jgi:D-alanyl-D-alanine carboxypeptidase/D-alanyl-D-alanine-endopeptidase (penicillin-binding protein 4)
VDYDDRSNRIDVAGKGCEIALRRSTEDRVSGPGEPTSGPSEELSWPTEDDDSGEFEVPSEAVTVQVERPRQTPPPPQRPPEQATMRMQVPRPQQQLPPPPPPPPMPRPQPQPEQPQPRAQPQRIVAQSEPIHDDGWAEEVVEDEPKPKSRKRLLLVSSLVLVVALAGGAVFAANRLDWFGGTATATTQPPAPPAKVSLSVQGIGTDAPAPSASGIKATLTGPASAAVLGTLTGTVVDPATGTVLWQQGDTTPLTPASTIKILAAAAALLSIEHTAQFSTKVVQGDTPGTVVVIGGGDPTLSSMPAGVDTVYPGAATLDDLAAQVKANAGGPITQVLFDLSRYAGDGMAPQWDNADIPGGDVTPIVPFMVDGGRQNPQASVSPRSLTPAMTAANALAERLGAPGAAAGAAPANPNVKVLGEVKSAPMDQLVENAMQISDNVLAEAIAREVARVNGQQPTFDGAVKAVTSVLTQNGFDLTGASFVDASGLSTADKLPAKLLGNILAVAAKPDAGDPRTAKLRPLLTALPVAGGSGTLAPRFKDASAAGKGWVRAKTGTLSNVNSLAGAVVDTDGRLLVFAFMSNNPAQNDAAPVREALDVLATTLRGCGCS